jgi:hypothetical protein
LTYISSHGKFIHQREGQAAPEGYTKIWKASHPPKLMVVLGIPAREQSGLYIVPETVKGEKKFIDHTLKQIVKKYIPLLYHGKEQKLNTHRQCRLPCLF